MHLELAALYTAQLGYILASRELAHDPASASRRRLAA